jgi:hypothetical protein
MVPKRKGSDGDTGEMRKMFTVKAKLDTNKGADDGESLETMAVWLDSKRSTVSTILASTYAETPRSPAKSRTNSHTLSLQIAPRPKGLRNKI